MNDPIISVCIPVYNGEKYIAKAIQSVLSQTFKDFELLISNNCSTDNTEQIIKKFSDERIKYLKNEVNLGMVGNWNICLDNVKGQYIQFLCADDYISNNCLEEKLIAMKNEGVDLVFNATNLINSQEKVIMKRRPYHYNKIFDGKKFARKSFLLKNIYGEPSNVMFTKEACIKAGHFDTRLCYAIDWDYWLKLSKFGKVCYLDDYLSYYRVSNNSETSNLFKTKDKFKQDDSYLIQNFLRNSDININVFDIFIHKLNVKLRMYARELFHIFNNFKLGVKS